ncbi:MAG: alpha-amylase family glycosyl hydrolase [Chloroherpetonaceae bacterium]|nr:alpha-amylase family glycosyl hydrolase [Chloroherpetonaceae bacterium]
MVMQYTGLFALLFFSFFAQAFGQDSVSILFRYQSLSNPSPSRVHFPGQFNNWGPNTNGNIAAGTPSQANFNSATGLWERVIRLPLGTYEYKINENGLVTGWRTDPLNRRYNPQDNDNSILTVEPLTLFQVAVFPYTSGSKPFNQPFVVRTARPVLTAGIFLAPNVSLSSLSASLDGVSIPNALSFYNPATGIFSYQPPSNLTDGVRTFRISATSSTGLTRTDSIQFEVRARTIQIETPSFTTRKDSFNIGGFVNDSRITAVQIRVGNALPVVQSVVNGSFDRFVPLQNGRNVIVVSATIDNQTVSDSVIITKFVPQAPVARVSITASGNAITLSAAESTDPQGQPLTFIWRDLEGVPLGLTGRTGTTVSIPKPSRAGDYPFQLIARDPDGNADTVRQYFTVRPNGEVLNTRYETSPDWVRQMRLYLLFPKAASNQNTNILRDLIQRGRDPGGLQYIRDMGFNVIWMMPVMKTDNDRIDNNIGIGYNIVDFYSVVSTYGTLQDFKDFVTEAHRLGLKVILDVTPNHTGRNHPWAQSARTLGRRSPYFTWYQRQIPTSGPGTNTNGLGWGIDAAGFVYYGGFSQALLNFEWSDLDARHAMLDVYKYWLKEFNLDGFRFDVYWGPHRRYGKANFNEFLRSELKRIKGDIYLLAESDGTGPGSETIFADHISGGLRGGADAGYDWKLYGGAIRNFNFSAPSINALHNELFNNGFYPGTNSYYLQFLENKDEDRIAFLYRTADTLTAYRRTMPMASVIFTAPGHPLLYTGQEVGAGFPTTATNLGEPDLNVRRRGIVNWNHFGRALLMPHYQRLAHIRAQFPAFWTQTLVRLNTANNFVYAFTRPFENQNGITVVNFSNQLQTVTLDLRTPNAVLFTGGIQDGATYFLNNLYSDTRRQVRGSELSAVSVSLPPFGTAIFTLSTTPDAVVIQNPLSLPKSEATVPKTFALEQNYPNPFNPTTTIRYQLPVASDVSLKVYDVLGREIATLVRARQAAGAYQVQWSADAGLSSGVYFYRLQAGNFVQTRKMMLIK